MEITIPELLRGKGTLIKSKEYLSTRAYVEPFLERMSKITNDFNVQVKLPDQITTIDDKEDITYNRVLIQATLPSEYSFDNHEQVIGFLYGLDTRKPIVKMYRGGLNMACLNLCVFSPEWLNVQELEPEAAIDYTPINELIEKTDDLHKWINKLKQTSFNKNQDLIERYTGQWLHNTLKYDYNNGLSKVKLSAGNVVDATKALFLDDKSDYYVKPEEDSVSMFKVYNAFTDLISNDKGKDLMNKTEKTLLLKNILGL